jgi:oxalate decarboxylase
MSDTFPKTLGQYIENTGNTDLIFLEMFKASRFEDLSLSEWVAHTPPKLVIEHLGITAEVLSKLPQTKLAIVPV